MNESWTCRDYQEGDEHQILSLFDEVFGKKMSLDFWRWRFRDNPFGQGIIKLLFDGNELIGHYAVMPIVVRVVDKPLKAVFSMTTMTHPSYAGKGIFTYLAEETYTTSKSKGYQFAYGFPNKNSYSGFVRKLGWLDLGKITILEKKLAPSTIMPSKAKYVMKEVKYFDNTINKLWDGVQRDYAAIVPRNDIFLNWRFAQNPNATYAKYVALDSANSISGYLILKTYQENDITKGHIVDMLANPDTHLVASLVEYACGYFEERSINNISCWIPPKSIYDDVLVDNGFVRSETETYFGFRSFTDDAELNKSLSDIANWYITMGDSDVF